MYNSKIKYVFNSKTNNYELRHYHNNKVNCKTYPLTPPLSVIKHWSKLFNNRTCITMQQAASNNTIHSSKHTDSTNHTQHSNLLSVDQCSEDLNTTCTQYTQTTPSPTPTPCPPIVNPSPPPSQ